MRPIDKGTVPKIDHEDKTVSDYKDWREDLLERIGNYCAYCNMLLNDSPQVEHVAPKSSHPQLQLNWNNMLLACGPCNRAKSNHAYDNETHYMPDYHNTQIAFEYIVVAHPKRKKLMACIPVPRELDLVEFAKAQKTIDLFKLDSITSNPRATDLRWKYRFEAFASSRLWRESWDNWGKNMQDVFIPLLIDAAKGKGFFSIWFDCFIDVSSIKKALIENFPGTRKSCFSEIDEFNPLPINEGDL